MGVEVKIYNRPKSPFALTFSFGSESLFKQECAVYCSKITQK